MHNKMVGTPSNKDKLPRHIYFENDIGKCDIDHDFDYSKSEYFNISGEEMSELIDLPVDYL